MKSSEKTTQDFVDQPQTTLDAESIEQEGGQKVQPALHQKYIVSSDSKST